MARALYARKRLDLTRADLGRAALAAIRPRATLEPERIEASLSARWTDGREVVATLSVRTGFDLALAALGWRAGDEILYSEITIPHMPALARAHGLVPIPVPIDPETLAPYPGAIASLAGPRTRAIVIAHLFGARLDMGPIVREARAAKLFVFEDCAQVFEGATYRGDRRADVSMFSFGTIKTATAFGGALLSVRDPELAARMRRAHASYARQPARAWAKRAARSAALNAVATPPAYAALVVALGLAGRDYDAIVRAATRGFSGEDWLKRVRARPSGALLAALESRLRGFDAARHAERARCGARFRAALRPELVRLGRRAERHSYWLFPASVANPGPTIAALRAQGFDATSGSSTLIAIQGAEKTRPSAAALLMRGAVYLPVYPGVGAKALARMARALHRVARPIEGLAPTEARALAG